MGFNYRQERKKFEERMQAQEEKYWAAGMNEDQIAAMREYEEEQFRRERIYKIHIVLEQSKEYPGLIEWVASSDHYFQGLTCSLDSILDNLAPGTACQLTFRDKEVLLLLAQGNTQQEVADLLQISQVAVFKHLQKIKKILKKGL